MDKSCFKGKGTADGVDNCKTKNYRKEKEEELRIIGAFPKEGVFIDD